MEANSRKQERADKTLQSSQAHLRMARSFFRPVRDGTQRVKQANLSLFCANGSDRIMSHHNTRCDFSCLWKWPLLDASKGNNERTVSLTTGSLFDVSQSEIFSRVWICGLWELPFFCSVVLVSKIVKTKNNFFFLCCLNWENIWAEYFYIFINIFYCPQNCIFNFK